MKVLILGFTRLSGAQFSDKFHIRHLAPSEGHGYDLFYYDGVSLRDEKWRFDYANRDTAVNRRFGVKNLQSSQFHVTDTLSDANGFRQKTRILRDPASIESLLAMRVEAPETQENFQRFGIMPRIKTRDNSLQEGQPRDPTLGLLNGVTLGVTLNRPTAPGESYVQGFVQTGFGAQNNRPGLQFALPNLGILPGSRPSNDAPARPAFGFPFFGNNGGSTPQSLPPPPPPQQNGPNLFGFPFGNRDPAPPQPPPSQPALQNSPQQPNFFAGLQNLNIPFIGPQTTTTIATEVPVPVTNAPLFANFPNLGFQNNNKPAITVTTTTTPAPQRPFANLQFPFGNFGQTTTTTTSAPETTTTQRPFGLNIPIISGLFQNNNNGKGSNNGKKQDNRLNAPGHANGHHGHPNNNHRPRPNGGSEHVFQTENAKLPPTTTQKVEVNSYEYNEFFPAPEDVTTRLSEELTPPPLTSSITEEKLITLAPITTGLSDSNFKVVEPSTVSNNPELFSFVESLEPVVHTNSFGFGIQEPSTQQHIHSSSSVDPFNVASARSDDVAEQIVPVKTAPSFISLLNQIFKANDDIVNTNKDEPTVSDISTLSDNPPFPQISSDKEVSTPSSILPVPILELVPPFEPGVFGVIEDHSLSKINGAGSKESSFVPGIIDLIKQSQNNISTSDLVELTDRPEIATRILDQELPSSIKLQSNEIIGINSLVQNNIREPDLDILPPFEDVNEEVLHKDNLISSTTTPPKIDSTKEESFSIVIPPESDLLPPFESVQTADAVENKSTITTTTNIASTITTSTTPQTDTLLKTTNSRTTTTTPRTTTTKLDTTTQTRSSTTTIRPITITTRLIIPEQPAIDLQPPLVVLPDTSVQTTRAQSTEKLLTSRNTTITTPRTTITTPLTITTTPRSTTTTQHSTTKAQLLVPKQPEIDLLPPFISASDTLITKTSTLVKNNEITTIAATTTASTPRGIFITPPTSTTIPRSTTTTPRSSTTTPRSTTTTPRSTTTIQRLTTKAQQLIPKQPEIDLLPPFIVVPDTSITKTSASVKSNTATTTASTPRTTLTTPRTSTTIVHTTSSTLRSTTTVQHLIPQKLVVDLVPPSVHSPAVFKENTDNVITSTTTVKTPQTPTTKISHIRVPLPEIDLLPPIEMVTISTTAKLPGTTAKEPEIDLLPPLEVANNVFAVETEVEINAITKQPPTTINPTIQNSITQSNSTTAIPIIAVNVPDINILPPFEDDVKQIMEVQTKEITLTTTTNNPIKITATPRPQTQPIYERTTEKNTIFTVGKTNTSAVSSPEIDLLPPFEIDPVISDKLKEIVVTTPEQKFTTAIPTTTSKTTLVTTMEIANAVSRFSGNQLSDNVVLPDTELLPPFESVANRFKSEPSSELKMFPPLDGVSKAVSTTNIPLTKMTTTTTSPITITTTTSRPTTNLVPHTTTTERPTTQPLTSRITTTITERTTRTIQPTTLNLITTSTTVKPVPSVAKPSKFFLPPFNTPIYKLDLTKGLIRVTEPFDYSGTGKTTKQLDESTIRAETDKILSSVKKIVESSSQSFLPTVTKPPPRVTSTTQKTTRYERSSTTTGRPHRTSPHRTSSHRTKTPELRIVPPNAGKHKHYHVRLPDTVLLPPSKPKPGQVLVYELASHINQGSKPLDGPIVFPKIPDSVLLPPFKIDIDETHASSIASSLPPKKQELSPSSISSLSSNAQNTGFVFPENFPAPTTEALPNFSQLGGGESSTQPSIAINGTTKAAIKRPVFVNVDDDEENVEDDNMEMTTAIGLDNRLHPNAIKSLIG